MKPRLLLNAAGSDSSSGSPPSKPTTGNTVLDVNAKVVVNGKELTIGELIASHNANSAVASELSTYKERWAATQTVLKAGDEFTPQTETAFRRVLSDSGYSPSDIEEAVAARRTPSDDSTLTPNPKGSGGQKSGAADGTQPQGGAEGWTPAAIKTYTELLNKELRTSAEKVLTEDPALVNLLKPLAEAARTDSTAKTKLDKAKADLMSDIRRESISELQRLQGQLGSNFKVDLVPDVVSRAAKTLSEKYSQYASLPGHMGKVQTVTPEEKYGVAGQGPAEPKFTPDTNPQKLADDTQNYNLWVLNKAAADLEKQESGSFA